MSLEEKIFLIFISGMVGVISSIITLFIKGSLDIRKEKRVSNQLKSEIENYRKSGENVEEGHPIYTLFSIKNNLERDLKEEWGDHLIERVRLYLEVDEQILKHSDYYSKVKRDNAKDESIVTTA